MISAQAKSWDDLQVLRGSEVPHRADPVRCDHGRTISMGNSKGRPSKNFGESNKHNGASISQSGRQKRFVAVPPTPRPGPATATEASVTPRGGRRLVGRLLAVAVMATAVASISDVAGAAVAPSHKAPWTCDVTRHASTYSGHGNAVDFNNLADGSDNGKPVVASAPGTAVAKWDTVSTYGNYVQIDHGNGWMTRYAHLRDLPSLTDRNPSQPGVQVLQGDVIGNVGGTPNYQPHLHYEQRYNGVSQPVAFDNSVIAVGTTYTSARDPIHKSTNCGSGGTTTSTYGQSSTEKSPYVGRMIRHPGGTVDYLAATGFRYWVPNGDVVSCLGGS